jgi:hypothetical protein
MVGGDEITVGAEMYEEHGVPVFETAPPITPIQEVEQFLEADERRLGDVYRLDKEGLSAEEIAQRLNVATPGFVYSYRYQIEAALTGRVSSSPHIQKQVMSSMRSLLRRGRDTLSPDALDFLNANLAAVTLLAATDDPAVDARAGREEEQEATDSIGRLKGMPGIYAFSYGWYLESPVEPITGNTLIKVGYAANVAARISQHVTGVRTHMPEPLVLVRVFSAPLSDLQRTEKGFHQLLATAGHSNPRREGRARRQVGTEWYLTNEDFLDAIADVMGLRTEYIGRSEFAEGSV